MSRARVWTFITYPDSMPSNFKEIIEGDTDPQHDISLIPFVMSPLHDKDLADEGKGHNGTPYKKPHFHNMIMFSQVKSFNQVKGMVEVLGAGHVSQVHSTQAMVRYFIHADHKKKAQYKRDDINAFNGADLDNLFEKNDREINGILKKIIETINDNDITEYNQLVNLCLTQEYFDEWFPLVSGKYQYFLSTYLKSKHFQMKT